MDVKTFFPELYEPTLQPFPTTAETTPPATDDALTRLRFPPPNSPAAWCAHRHSPNRTPLDFVPVPAPQFSSADIGLARSHIERCVYPRLRARESKRPVAPLRPRPPVRSHP